MIHSKFKINPQFLIKKKCNELNPNFCHICGQFYKKSSLRPFTDYLKDRYYKTFKYHPRHMDKPWTGQSICSNCTKLMGKHDDKTFPFRPTLWREPDHNHSNCYMCNFEFHSVNHQIAYCPLSSNCSIVLPTDRILAETETENDDSTEDEMETSMRMLNLSGELCSTPIKDDDYLPDFEINNMNNLRTPRLFDQKSLNDLLRGMMATIEQSLFLASVLKSRGLLEPEVRVNFFKTR